MDPSHHSHQAESSQEGGELTDERLASLADSQLSLGQAKPALEPISEGSVATSATGLSPSASSILRVLLPSLTKLDSLLESVWDKQDMLNEVLNRLDAELEQFDELVVPPSISPLTTGGTAASNKSSARGQRAAQRLKESRTRIGDINVTLKKVRARLDNISMLAQAKVLQNQQTSQTRQSHHHQTFSPPK